MDNLRLQRRADLGTSQRRNNVNLLRINMKISPKVWKRLQLRIVERGIWRSEKFVILTNAQVPQLSHTPKGSLKNGSRHARDHLDEMRSDGPLIPKWLS